MKRLSLLRDLNANAAVEMALVAPLLLALLCGSVELGNYFMTEHALEKQVRDGARYASRLSLSDTYSCPDTVFADANADSDIINVTETGAVSGSGFPRFSPTYWARTCGTDSQPVTVSVRCVSKSDIDSGGSGNSGIYASLNGDIPVVKVSARVKYLSVLSQLGFKAATNICLQAESESAVQGI